MKSNKSIWTKDFSIITIGTIISAIGGTAINLAMSLVVFDETASTWLTGVLTAASYLPGILLPFFFAPYIDSHNRKNIMVTLDFLSSIFYLLFYLYVRNYSFSYEIYLLFCLLTGGIGAIYSLNYEAFYPELIEKGMEQKGYAISSLIYPSVTALITPVAAVVYGNYGIEWIILGEGILLFLAAGCECFITNIDIHRKKKYREKENSGFKKKEKREYLKEYKEELLGGVCYLKKEKGVRNIYLYMMSVNAIGEGNRLMTLAYFQSSNYLTTAMYSFLISAETIGRMLGGIGHYFIKIPVKKRYKITEKVYQMYEILDGTMLFVAYPVMIVFRFICGFLGVNTATLRQAAVQNYIPSQIRARVNGLFQVLISIGMMIIPLLTGALGEIISYPVISLFLGIISLFLIYQLIIKNQTEIRKVYEKEE